MGPPPPPATPLQSIVDNMQNVNSLGACVVDSGFGPLKKKKAEQLVSIISTLKCFLHLAAAALRPKGWNTDQIRWQ